jgi:hypothetical protein
MRTMKRQLRQGDVLLIQVSGLGLAFRTLKVAPRDAGRVVLAYGEVTGHAHAIEESNVALLVADDRAAMAAAARELLASVGLTTEIRDEEVVGVLEVSEPSTLRHEEHGHIALAEGERFVVLRQREYQPAGIQQVAD